MSDDIHPTRLVWDGRRGLAKHEEARVILRGPPPALPDIAEIDYVPGIVAQIRRHSWDKVDDMRPPEIVAVLSWLEGLLRWNKRYLMLRPRGHK